MSLARLSARGEAILSTYAVNILFFITYGISVVLMFLWGLQSELSTKLERERLYDWIIGIGRGAGYILNFNTALVILLASRLFLTALRDTAFASGLPLDKAFPKLHVIVGYTIFFTLFIHVPFHFVWIIKYNEWEAGLWNVNMTVATGSCLLLVFLAMFIFAQVGFRKNKFRLFYNVHLVGAFLFFGLLIFHGMYYFDPETYKYISGPVIIYVADRIIRRWRVITHDLDLSTENSNFKDNDVLELTCPKPFEFKPGQYAEIRVPSINHEWHPFTIASAQYENTMTFYIKSLGDWTSALHKEFQNRLSGEENSPLKVRIRGPFGAPAQQVDKYQRIVLVSGGIGATPFMSICKQLHYLHSQSSFHLSGPDRSKKSEKAAQNAIIADDVENRIKNSLESIYGFNVSDLDISSSFQKSSKAKYLDRNQDLIPGPIAMNKAEESFETDTESSSDDRLTAEDPSANSLSGDDQHAFRGLKHAKAHNNGPSADVVLEISSDSTFQKKKVANSSDEEIAQVEGHPDLGSPPDRKSRLNLLFFLHSSQVSFILCILAICRLAVVIAGSIYKSDYVMFAYLPRNADSGVTPNGPWLPLTYASISVPIAVVMLFTILLEVSLWKTLTFRSVRRSIEVVVFGPALLALTSIEFWRGITETHAGQAVVLLQYILLQSIVIVLLLGRMLRAVEKCELPLDDTRRLYEKYNLSVPDVDFIWTARHSDEDAWLRREVCEVADGQAVRVHRYITRGDESDKNDTCALDKAEEGDVRAVDLGTEIGRPDFDHLLALAARDTRSDGVIGLFFCGPSKMGQVLRHSARKIEIWSNLRGVYLRSTDGLKLMRDLKLPSPGHVERLRRNGCSVRFVFIEENFG